jgi:5-methylcytosine-specific restriction endonuclease McrA
MQGGRANRADLPKGQNGRALCRWCNLEVPPRRLTFCSEWCVHEWKIRTDPGYLREHVFQRDKGICAMCRADTRAAYFQLKLSRGIHRERLLARWGLKRINRKSLWDADHIIPVAEGGGECDLDNLQTLCVMCHRKKTVDLRQRLSAKLLQRR